MKFVSPRYYCCFPFVMLALIPVLLSVPLHGFQQTGGIQIGDQIQLVAPELGSDWVRGTVGSVGRDGIGLIHRGTEHTISFGAIEALQVRKRPASLTRAAIIYGVIGFVLSAGLIEFSRAVCWSECTVPAGKRILVMGSITTMTSAFGVLAQMSGNARRPWYPVYPADLMTRSGSSVFSLLRVRF